MCGIFGYIGTRPAIPVLVEGLRRLEYRGYDSTGVAIHDGDKITVHKTVGKVQDLQSVLPEEVPGTMGIAHTRWATHGGVTFVNTHPHASHDGKIHLVHNGSIENFRSLHRRVQSHGIECVGQTAAAGIVQLISIKLSPRATPQGAAELTPTPLRRRRA